MYSEQFQSLESRVRPLSILVGVGLTIVVLYAFRKQVFHYTGMSLQGRR